RGRREAEPRQTLEKKFDVAELERNVKESSRWQEEGSDYLGKRVKRVFGRRVAGAT
ncbi:unnamed protein product, partial [Pylaiella littoralis]